METAIKFIRTKIISVLMLVCYVHTFQSCQNSACQFYTNHTIMMPRKLQNMWSNNKCIHNCSEYLSLLLHSSNLFNHSLILNNKTSSVEIKFYF